MKTKRVMAAVCGTMLWAGVALGQPFDYSFTFTNGFNNGGVIPDGTPLGLTLGTNLTGRFAPQQGTISAVTVGLNISGGYNGDLYAYLAGPNGGFAILLNRAGVSNNASAFGYSDSGFNVTLSAAGANSIQYYQNYTNPAGGMVSGIWQPEGVNIAPQSPPPAFLTAGQTAMLGSMDGHDASGTWTLFLADLSAGGQGTVESWSLDITTVPEPGVLALGALGIGLIAARKMGRRKNFR
jgi:subtilisin-like proprotein convertase family protein